MKEITLELAGLRFSSNRTYGGEGEIQILAEDIKRNGLINPITVKLAPEDSDYEERAPIYYVVAGRRRVLAATKLGWKEIACRILEGDEIERADEIAGAENINRLEMHPLDEAAVFQKLLANGVTIEELAKRYDRSVSAIYQRVQLLTLNEDIKTLFRNGNLSLHCAAMLKSLSDDTQRAFAKQYKNGWEVKRGEEIGDHQIRNFISSLGYDRLYGFVKDKQCSDCKTRTYFGDTNLFPELNNASDSCLNHECYMSKWDIALSERIKSLKRKHKSHASACIIVTRDNGIQKILGNTATIDGVRYKVLPDDFYSRANARDKGAMPCFNISITGPGKLEISTEYWKKPEKGVSRYSGSSESPTAKKKAFAPVVEVLNLAHDEKNAALDAMSNSKRISPYTFSSNVRDSVFWRIIEIKAQEFNDPKAVNHDYKEMFLKKYFHYLAGADKKIFEMFVGKMSISDLAKLASDKIYGLLLAMEWNPYDLPNPEHLGKEKQNEILKWVGLAPDKLKEIYQDEIRKRIPKQKPEEKKTAKQGTSEAKKPVAKKPPKPTKQGKAKAPFHGA